MSDVYCVCVSVCVCEEVCVTRKEEEWEEEREEGGMRKVGADTELKTKKHTSMWGKIGKYSSKPLLVDDYSHWLKTTQKNMI